MFIKSLFIVSFGVGVYLLTKYYYELKIDKLKKDMDEELKRKMEALDILMNQDTDEFVFT